MKNRLRKEVIERLNNLSKREISNKSQKIKKRLFQTKPFVQAQNICFYVSFRNEVYTHDMIKDSLMGNKTVYVPKLKNESIVHIRIDDLKRLDQKNRYGILEPSDNTSFIIPVELTIIPGIAFDKKGNRIGRGKGAYDRYLKNNQSTRIGLCFEEQIIDNIPHEKHDCPVDYIITEKRTIRCN